MNIIDLLNKIANGEEVPKYVQYYNMLKNKTDIMWVCKENLFYKLDQLEIQLNSRVEVLKEKELPEKLDIEQDSPTSNYYIRNEYGTKCGLTKHSKIIADKLNEIIDYLEKQR